MGQVNFTDVFIIFIFLGALGGGALLVIFFLYRSIAEAQKREKAVTQWPSVTGTVVKSEVKVRKTSEDYTEYPDITYTYEVMGKAYRCKQILPGGEIGGMGVESTLKRYPMNAQVTVYYNPQNPKDAVLEAGNRTISKGLWLMLVLMNIFICGMGLYFTYGKLK